MKTFSRSIRRLVFQIGYSALAITCLLWVAIFLQAGKSGAYLFVVRDLFTEPQRLIFVLSFAVTYLASVLVLGHVLRIPRFDFLNRILAINVVIYSFLGLALSAFRLPLVSREVFIIEFILSGLQLVIYYLLCHRMFPRRLGVLTDVNIAPFEVYSSIEAVSVDAQHIQNRQFDGIVADLRRVTNDSITQLLAGLAQRRVVVYDSSSLIEILWGRVPLTNLTSVEIDNLTPPVVYKPIKRLIELILVLLCAPLLIVLWLIISIAIKLDSPGPVLFRQTRCGLNGTSFTMFKFRSMFETEEIESRFAEKIDKRVTRVGRVLRRSRLDELPQVLNVIKGDMSVIGPRPEQLEFTDRFEQRIPYYGFRHTIPPGITGWAQVMFGYAASDEETRAKLEFDFFYIKHMSAWLDFIVILKTIRTMILGLGAR